MSLDILDILQLWPPFGGAGPIIGPGGVTSFTLSGPATGYVGFGSGFTVTLGSGTQSSPVTIAPHMTVIPGVFTPSTLVLTDSVRSGDFSFEPSAEGAGTVSMTNNGGLTNPAALSFSVTTLAPFDGGTIPVNVLRPAALWRHGRLSDWRRPRG